MQPNPFALPHAFLEHNADTRLRLPRRPVSVWFMLVIASVVAALLALASGSTVPWSVLADPSRGGLQLEAVLALVAAIVLGATVIGVHRGAAWSRWAGLLFIAYRFATALHTVVAPFGGAGPFSGWGRVVPSADQAGAEVIARLLGVVGCALHAWWFFAFGFSRRSRTYFDVASRTRDIDVQPS
jgi:hypothetical protein